MQVQRVVGCGRYCAVSEAVLMATARAEAVIAFSRDGAI